MGRKSANTDLALLNAGIELIANGNYDPTVREICQLAQANQGTFVYYFGTKDDYIKIIFQKIYDEYILYLQSYPNKKVSASQQLEQIYFRMAQYFIKNFNTAFFITNGLQRHKHIAYFTEYRVKHFTFISELIAEAQKNGDICQDLNHLQIHLLLQDIILQPIITKKTVFSQLTEQKIIMELNKIDFTSSSSIRKRMRIAFKGLRPERT